MSRAIREAGSRSMAPGVSAIRKSRSAATRVVASCVLRDSRQAMRTRKGSGCSAATSATAVGRHDGAWRSSVRITVSISPAVMGARTAADSQGGVEAERERERARRFGKMTPERGRRVSVASGGCQTGFERHWSHRRYNRRRRRTLVVRTVCRAPPDSTQIEASALGSRCHWKVGTHVPDGTLNGGFQGIVVPPGVVMERYEMLHVRKPSDGQGIVDGTVPPTDVVRILLARILRVVEQ